MFASVTIFASRTTHSIIFSDGATGMGPERAIIRRIFEQLMTEKDFSSLWISLGDFQAI